MSAIQAQAATLENAIAVYDPFCASTEADKVDTLEMNQIEYLDAVVAYAPIEISFK